MSLSRFCPMADGSRSPGSSARGFAVGVDGLWCNSVRNLGSLVRCAILVLLLARAGDAAPASVADSLLLVYEANRLSVKQSAPVSYSDLSSMMTSIQRASLVGRYAIVLFRDSPREIIGYVLAIERGGTLSLGSQLHEWDSGDRRYRFLRGDLYRSYQPLEGNVPWTWLVTIPVSRERQASLVIRAVEARWPVESVSISVMAQPTY